MCVCRVVFMGSKKITAWERNEMREKLVNMKK